MNNFLKFMKLLAKAFLYIIVFIILMIFANKSSVFAEMLGSSLVYFIIFSFVIWMIYKTSYNYKLAVWTIPVIATLLFVFFWYAGANMAINTWAILLGALLAWFLLSKNTKKDRLNTTLVSEAKLKS